MRDATGSSHPGRRRRKRLLFSAVIAALAAGSALSLGATSRPVGEGMPRDAAQSTAASPAANGITRVVRDEPSKRETPARSRAERPSLATPEPDGAADQPHTSPTPAAPAADSTPTAQVPGLQNRTLAETFVTPMATPERGHLPLDELAPDAAHLARQAGTVGVAVVVAGEDTVYAEGGLTPFPLASLAKVPLMLTVMDRATAEGRSLSEDEIEQLESMIAVSDNVATSALWEEVGGGSEVAAFLRSAGLEGIGPASNAEWGDTQGTAVGIARMMMAIAEGDLPRAEHGEIALNVLAGVIDEQRWGVSEGFRPRPGARALLLKNGWFPAEDGWWVNSAGVVVADDGSPRYALAVLTRGRESEQAGRLLIEVIAARIHAAMRVR